MVMQRVANPCTLIRTGGSSPPPSASICTCPYDKQISDLKGVFLTTVTVNCFSRPTDKVSENPRLHLAR